MTTSLFHWTVVQSDCLSWRNQVDWLVPSWSASPLQLGHRNRAHCRRGWSIQPSLDSDSVPVRNTVPYLTRCSSPQYSSHSFVVQVPCSIFESLTRSSNSLDSLPEPPLFRDRASF